MREAGFDAEKGRERTGERRSGVLMAAKVTWETISKVTGDADGQRWQIVIGGDVRKVTYVTS